ncbi:MAG: hypothetical protein EOM51_07010 [Clostridia bacterium]|nr:hypothetical protein [Clostridia bacterium]
MNYSERGARKTLGGRELTFIRCDRDGNIIEEATLKNLGITNATIERIVGDVSARIAPTEADGSFEGGIITD